jgi:hypothetical protein
MINNSIQSSDLKLALELAKSISTEVHDIIKPNEQVTFELGPQILPLNLFKSTRGYIEKIAIQINQTYEHTCYDACAVMMRRLIEVLIILSFENAGIDDLIRDKGTGNYFMLSELVPIFLNTSKLKVSRIPKQHLLQFKNFGDFSAHKLNYSAQRGDIDDMFNKHFFRVCIEEMLYLSGLKK